MKRVKYLLLVFIVLFLFNTQAQNEAKIDNEKLEVFANRICHLALTFRTSNAKQAGYNIEEFVLNWIGISKEDPNYKEKLTKWWNENNHRFICHEEGITERTRNPQHFLKRVVDLGMHKLVLYDFLLSDEDDYPIDVNAVEIYNGKEETLLDYLDKILSNPNNEKTYNMKEIEWLRFTIIEDYSAKRASELKK